MPLYNIRWEIDVDKPTAKEAADWAWKVMKEKENEATYLDVYDTEDDNLVGQFDMDEQEGR